MRLQILVAAALVAGPALAEEVGITKEMPRAVFESGGETLEIGRIQDTDNVVTGEWAMTSRACPPFCVQPIKAAPGVETVGELEVLGYLQRIARGDTSVLVVDSRTAQWPRRGMIPGAVNIPWRAFDPQYADAKAIGKIFYEEFGARYRNGRWDYQPAKTLVLYCNGMWCSQSTRSIQVLLGYGYPPEKIKWYRGGMQAWESLGLTIVKGKAQ